MSLSLADQTILERKLRPAFSAALVEEHRQRPFGPHSADLASLLLFLRRNPDPQKLRYCVLRSGQPPRWGLGHKPVVAGAAITSIGPACYASRGDAEHAVFLRRLQDYGLLASGETPPHPAAAVEPPGLMGYLDTLSAAPGQSVTLHVSARSPRWRADLVRLLCADLAPEGPPLREEVVTSVAPVECDAIVQSTTVGSYGRVDLPDPPFDVAAGFSLCVLAMPTLPGDGVQTLLAQRDAAGDAGWALFLDECGVPAFWLGGADGGTTLALAEPLLRGCWSQIAVVVDAQARRVRLACAPAGTRASNRVWIGRGRAQSAQAELKSAPVLATARPLLMAAAWLDAKGQPQQRFDGRLERPTLIGGVRKLDALLAPQPDADAALAALAPLALWDFAAGLGRSGIAHVAQLHDRGAHGWHARLHQHPVRGVTSHAWDGLEFDFRHALQQYAAAHFHRDDMSDCGWTPQAQIRIPDDLPSGVYAVRLQALGDDSGAVDRIPFAVRPPDGQATAPVLLVLSTNAYLAYANDHVGVDSPRMQMMVRRALQYDEFDLYRHHHRELGASLYEAHADGTGNCYSSARRPILTMRPQTQTFNGRTWQFQADLQIIDWLDRSGRAFDVVTDHDLHREGAALLSRYRCVMTGTHPEYPTRRMLDAYGDYVDDGGRLVYMGGNGFYWVTAYDQDDAQIIEIRRWAGSEAWRALPGEYHLSFTGEQGGLWRNNGRAPQKTVGVGMVAAGLVHGGAPYARCIGPDNRAAWVLEGVTRDVFGEHGTAGAAAGLEIDATDPELGTPAGTIVVATSGGRHPDEMLEARENYGMTLAAPGGSGNARVRADLALTPVDGSGGVFATGSIAFAGALAHDDDIARILSNVLDRFCSGQALLDPPVGADAGEPGTPPA
ncbi:N,N-dimethylformamidase beta subunit family domain-containing protein [Solimonas flava]|uniref:N,N-dimethylformamidase beta subunit family domain-containing protein n=1 Tax=Solimonas flava TaxID=415849 RepID=UPI0004034387|nr:N,N-dimethylformamidase beta subunit family domain-containing protein [Solimonas flava]